tara:strand:- start:1764 stop:2588 length:825 start_codon:yes stop_codon:yes gene_type:complete
MKLNLEFNPESESEIAEAVKLLTHIGLQKLSENVRNSEGYGSMTDTERVAAHLKANLDDPILNTPDHPEDVLILTDAERSALTATENTTPPANVPILRDTSGMLWDARIHQAAKGTKVDGTWKRKRNTDDALFTQVENELRASASQAPATVAEPVTPLAPEAPVTPLAPEAPVPATPVAMVYDHQGAKFSKEALVSAGWSEAQIATLTAVPADAPVPAAVEMTYADFVKKVTMAKIGPEVVTPILAKHGISSQMELAGRLEMLPAILADLGLSA